MWAESVLRSLKGADRSEGVHLKAFLTGDPSETQTPPETNRGCPETCRRVREFKERHSSSSNFTGCNPKPWERVDFLKVL